jgi:hypothetical protein
MEKVLTPKEREELIKRHRKKRDKRICDRIKAVLAYDEGYSYSQIAKILLLDDETIRRHIEDQSLLSLSDSLLRIYSEQPASCYQDLPAALLNRRYVNGFVLSLLP